MNVPHEVRGSNLTFHLPSTFHLLFFESMGTGFKSMGTSLNKNRRELAGFEPQSSLTAASALDPSTTAMPDRFYLIKLVFQVEEI